MHGWVDLLCTWNYHNIVNRLCVCVCVRTQLCPILRCPMDCSPPGSSVPGIFQARTLEWVAISYSRGSLWHRDGTHVSCISWIGSQIVYHWCHLYCNIKWNVFKKMHRVAISPGPSAQILERRTLQRDFVNFSSASRGRIQDQHRQPVYAWLLWALAVYFQRSFR